MVKKRFVAQAIMIRNGSTANVIRRGGTKIEIAIARQGTARELDACAA
jgi:hypothetical protein